MKSGAIFLKFWKLGSNYKTKSQIYPRHNSEIFENFGAMLMHMASDSHFITRNLTKMRDLNNTYKLFTLILKFVIMQLILKF